MNEYGITFELPVYGEAIIEAETEKEANEIAKNIANFKQDEWIDWHMESLYDGQPMAVVEVAFIKVIKEKPEQTDEEWFNSWQKELYADG
jgi:hypothetical protein